MHLQSDTKPDSMTFDTVRLSTDGGRKPTNVSEKVQDGKELTT